MNCPDPLTRIGWAQASNLTSLVILDSTEKLPVTLDLHRVSFSYNYKIITTVLFSRVVLVILSSDFQHRNLFSDREFYCSGF